MPEARTTPRVFSFCNFNVVLPAATDLLHAQSVQTLVVESPLSANQYLHELYYSTT